MCAYHTADIPTLDSKSRDRFWSKANIRHDGSSCWQWSGSTAKGYGRFGYSGISRPAHRIAFTLTHGEIPYGMFVCHHCDNPLCIRPSHLFLGTHDQNMSDMARKKRSRNGGMAPRGDSHGRSVLTDNEVRQLLLMYSVGWSYLYLSEFFSITRQHVGVLVSGKQRKHVFREVVAAYPLLQDKK